MSNECSFCGVRHIDTSMLILNNGEVWIEYCESCGKRETLVRKDAEGHMIEATIAQIAEDKGEFVAMYSNEYEYKRSRRIKAKIDELYFCWEHCDWQLRFWVENMSSFGKNKARN